MQHVLVGKPDVVRIALVTLLAEGHLLVEDVPGVGKTSLAKALAVSIDCSVSRVQFTPDLLPGDITGMSIYNRRTEEFEFRPGPVFANVVIARRDQPCLAQDPVRAAGVHGRAPGHGRRRHLRPGAARSSCVATQNPIEMDGTYPLPEAQRDRFTARVSIGYPDPAAELTMLDEHAAAEPLEQLRPVADAPTVQAVIEAVRRVRVGHEVRQYCVDLVTATRRLPDLRLGASPRATLQPGARRPGAGGAARARVRRSRTTCAPSPSPCWPTGCCSPPTPAPPGARPPSWCTAC